MVKERLFLVPHTHYDAAVFKTRAEYLTMGLPNILQALHILRKDPDYRYVFDQICYIRPFLERYPEEAPTFEAMVREGRLDVTCGMDTMMDVNIPCGESFVRQVIYGKGYARERLGVDVTEAWGLDTFGHHPQIPQLSVLAGFTSYFFSRGVPDTETKSEFLWEGLDGTAILACWLPYGYGLLHPVPDNPIAFAAAVTEVWDKLRPFATGPNVLALNGSDLGVPEAHTAERVRRFNQEDHPFEIVLATPREFLVALGDPSSLPRRRHDLNPVFPGCYSSRIKVKQENRKLEGLLLDCEALAAIDSWATPSADLMPARLPGRDLLDLWEPVLFNQFHDVICGVQTDKVYDDTMRAYHHTDIVARARLEEELQRLAARVDTRGPGVPLFVFNPLAWERRDLAEAEIGFTAGGITAIGLVDEQGDVVPCQIVEAQRFPDGGLKQVRILWIANVPSFGYRLYHLVPGMEYRGETDVSSNCAGRGAPGGPRTVNVTTGILENKFYRLTMDLWNGAITSIIGKQSGQEFLDTSVWPGLVVSREQDHGDPWEPNSVLKGGMSTASRRLITLPTPGPATFSSNYNGEGWTRHGPVMAEFGITHPFGSGLFELQVRLYQGLPRIDVRIGLINQDEFVRYRAVIPTTLRPARMVQEIPYGAVERPEMEFPAQTWTDVGNEARGLAVLNRGLPGHELRESTLLISLLRSTKIIRYAFHGGYEPGVPSDTGLELGVSHAFEFALIPHEGSWQSVGLAQAGAGYNRPLLTRKVAPHTGPLPPTGSFLAVSDPSAVVTAIKPGSDGDWVVRLYESVGRPISDVSLEFAGSVRYAEETDLLERRIGAAEFESRCLHCALRPWQIKTFRVRLDPP